jgi:hypothetical protein
LSLKHLRLSEVPTRDVTNSLRRCVQPRRDCLQLGCHEELVGCQLRDSVLLELHNGHRVGDLPSLPDLHEGHEQNECHKGVDDRVKVLWGCGVDLSRLR